MDSSNGASGTGYGCGGCHGRLEDAGNAVTGSAQLSGLGAGLRQHHYQAGQTVCVNCHADANPSNYTPVGEDVKPPYYDTADSLASNPCNPDATANLNENWSLMDFVGLDNDGDSDYDGADADCITVTGAPGETARDPLPMILVTARDATTMSMTYGTACGVTDNTIVFGALNNVSTYGYSGETCAILNSGTVTWDFVAAGTPDSFFFLIVGNDGVLEGSYGTDSDGAERSVHATNVACPLGQDLVDRCD